MSPRSSFLLEDAERPGFAGTSCALKERTFERRSSWESGIFYSAKHTRRCTATRMRSGGGDEVRQYASPGWGLSAQNAITMSRTDKAAQNQAAPA